MSKNLWHKVYGGIWKTLFSGLALLCLLPGSSWAPPACPSPPCGNPQSCDNSLVVSELQAMSFGRISIATSGSVILGTDGSRVGTGGVLLLSGASSAGSFSVTTGNRDCSTFPLVTVGVTAPATLTHTTLPANTMTVKNFQVNPGAGILFNPATTFNVGATLSATVGQVPGTYQGTYLLTITFQ